MKLMNGETSEGERRPGALRKGLAVTLSLALALGLGPWLALTPALAAPGGVINNSGFIEFDQAFFAFEVESPIDSLKGVPIWNELEYMLDDPYAFVLDSTVEGNPQGWPSYRLTQPRRRSFIYRVNGDTSANGVPCAPGSAGCVQVDLQKHVIHPLNYNHMTGEELRLLNVEFAGGPWTVADQLVLVEAANTDPADGPLGLAKYAFTYRDITVSPGEDRIEEEVSVSFNTTIGPDGPACVVSVDQFFLGPAAIFSPGPASPGFTTVGEGVIVCGGDPGEPGYAGFGVLLADLDEQYSTPAVPGPTARSGPGSLNPAVHRLFDPVRGYIQPRNPTTGEGGLNKPSLRVPPYGTPSNPGFLVNSETDLAADPAVLVPSNENDYFRGATRAEKEIARLAAAALGKALFWDMQVGSDTVQACGSCHFHAGADNRTKNQTNPDVNGGDLTLQLHGGVQNTDLVASDFPFQRGGQDTSNSPGNGFGNVNDVSSSMGVRFRVFDDIPTPGAGAFSSCANQPATCVPTLLPDIGAPAVDSFGNPLVDPVTGQALDPIPLFQGLRRVEPRNTPTFFNAAMNFDNFWDGRARHDFNGGSVFGATDPQAHVFVCPLNSGGNCAGADLVATRQIIRFVSLASLTTGPALSEFEMSFRGRNWAKLGKKLLQPVQDLTPAPSDVRGAVTPLANQLVEPTDSVIGLYSNQGGSACGALPPADRSGSFNPPANGTALGKPGLCISYPGLIRRAFSRALWGRAGRHLEGCFTDGLAIHATEQCAPGSVAIPVLGIVAGVPTVVDSAADPFDGYVLTIANGAAVKTNTNQFTQMEANMSLFAGLSVHAWGTMLVPDDSPLDRFFDANNDAFATFGESGEPGIAHDLLNCGQVNPLTGLPQQAPCFTEVGNFKRDPGVVARLGVSMEGIECVPPPLGTCVSVVSGGTRQAGAVDPLLGLDFFLGSNLSLKNRNFRTLRCGECHAGGTLTDHTFEVTHAVSFGDRIQEFVTGQPGVEAFPEALGRGRVISGFNLEDEINGNGQDAVERNVADFCAVAPCTSDPSHTPVNGFPQGQALFDNGVYNIGVTPIANDTMRGANDPFGWPFSLTYLALKNLGGVDYSPGGDDSLTGFAQPAPPGIPLPNFDPEIDPTSGGLFEPSPQDQQLNPGFEEEPAEPLLPPYLYPFANNVVVGDESNVDEVFVGLNTLMREPMLEGFVDTWGPFNPAAIIGETFNNARQPEMAMWPNVNRVNVQGSVKAPPLRFVARTAPYFHNGGKLTLRQQLDFYLRGGDFPKTNSAHRDFLIANLLVEDEALGGFVDPVTGGVVDPGTPGAVPEFTAAQKEEIIVSVIDFLLALTDERVDFQRAPFDQPEVFVPLDGTAPDNGSLAGAVVAGRQGFVNNTAGDCGGVPGAGACFRQVPATGAAGKATPTPNFLGVSDGPRKTAAQCAPGELNHYCP